MGGLLCCHVVCHIFPLGPYLDLDIVGGRYLDSPSFLFRFPFQRTVVGFNLLVNELSRVFFLSQRLKKDSI